MVGTPARRAFVLWAKSKGVSERCACRLVFLPRPTFRYRSRRQEDAPLSECLRKIAGKHKRFGYRRAHILLKRDGLVVNHKRVYRLWHSEGLSVQRRVKKKRSLRPKQERPCAAACVNHVWCVDFIHDQTMSGSSLRFLCLTDEWTRQSRAIVVGRSLTAAKVVQTLLEAIQETGAAPQFLRMDNGPEFIALALRGFCHRSGVKTAYIEPGCPWQNGFAESFHGKFRDEFLSQEVFLNIRDAQVRSAMWQRWYNEGRPHSSLGYRTPDEFAQEEEQNRQAGAGTNMADGT